MAFSAFLDADVLFPVGLRDSLLWIAHFEIYTPRWSADVLKEMRKNILEEHRHVTEKDLDEMIRDMQSAFPDAEVTGYQKFEAKILSCGLCPVILPISSPKAALVTASTTSRSFSTIGRTSMSSEGMCPDMGRVYLDKPAVQFPA